jgi:hypothetical protein
MALTDGLLAQVYPASGDAGIKDIVSDILFTGDGTPTLTTDEGVAAWLISTGTLLTKVLTERTVSGSVAGDGVTVAMRFKLTANGSNSFLSLAGFKGASDTVDQNIRITRNGSNNYRGRVNSVLSPSLTGLTNGTVITLVFRVTFRDGATDTGEIWKNTTGRSGTDPDAVSAGANFGTITFDRGFINCQTDAAYTLYDFALWGRELTNAECAAVADGYRDVMPAPSATVTPIAFAGTIPAQTFTAGDAVDVNLAGYFSGTETPFTFANTGTSLTGTGLSITSAGRLQGTATEGAVTGVVITGTDAEADTASSNAFNVTVNAIPALPPQGTVTIGTITVGETTASVPFSYDDTDETGFVYRLDGGSPVTVTANPIAITGLTAATEYSIEVAAVNAIGTGTYSAPAVFETDAAPSTDPVFTSAQPLRDNTAQLLNNTLLDYVRLYSVTTGELVAEFIDVTTNSSGYFSVTSALLTADAAYKADWQVNATGVGRMPQATAV